MSALGITKTWAVEGSSSSDSRNMVRLVAHECNWFVLFMFGRYPCPNPVEREIHANASEARHLHQHLPTSTSYMPTSLFLPLSRSTTMIVATLGKTGPFSHPELALDRVRLPFWVGGICIRRDYRSQSADVLPPRHQSVEPRWEAFIHNLFLLWGKRSGHSVGSPRLPELSVAVISAAW